MIRNYLLIVLCFLSLFRTQAQDVNWAEDVACLIYPHCSPCHNSYNNPEIQFMNFQDVYDQRLTVEIYVNTGKMPPGLTNSHYNKFAGDKGLTEQEINIIKVWARDLALRGDTTKEPVAPIYAKPVSTLINPEVSFKSGYVLPDTIEGHLRRCFILPNPGIKMKTIKSIEVVPADPYIVHSVFIYTDTSSIPLALDLSDSGEGYVNFFGTGSTSSKPLYGWTLGSGPFHMPPNTGLELDSSAYFIIQIQYAEEGANQTDSTIVNIKLDTSTNTRKAITSDLLNHEDNLINGPFELEVDSSKIFHEIYTVVNDLSLLSIAPHAHYYCDNMLVYAVLPNTDTVPLLKIDNWDAGWSEGSYFYQKPVHLPQGSAIHAFSLYSNTNSNLHDLNDSLEPLDGGVDEHHEEMVFNFTYLNYSTGDEHMVFDTLKHRLHYQACKPVHNVSSINSVIADQFDLFPNPATGTVTILSKKIYDSYSVVLYDIMGQEYLKKTFWDEKEAILDVSELITGIYFVQIVYGNNYEIRRIIVTD